MCDSLKPAPKCLLLINQKEILKRGTTWTVQKTNNTTFKVEQLNPNPLYIDLIHQCPHYTMEICKKGFRVIRLLSINLAYAWNPMQGEATLQISWASRSHSTILKVWSLISLLEENASYNASRGLQSIIWFVQVRFCKKYFVLLFHPTKT